MAIDSLHDLSDLNTRELYAVYLAIAVADHRWRERTMFGQSGAPSDHFAFRPLSIDQFADRMECARTLVGGEAMMRNRLARQAAAYEVDVHEELSRIRYAA